MPDRTIGIPYARGTVVKGRLVRTCPVCGVGVVEPDEKASEYAKHYAAMHERDVEADEQPDDVMGYTPGEDGPPPHPLNYDARRR